MKPDFEEAYKNYIENDTPDLWSRIQPQLTEQNFDSCSEGKESVWKSASSRKQEKTVEIIGKKHVPVKRILAFAMPLAAALCILVISSAAMKQSRSSQSDSAAMMTETAAVEEAYTEEAESYAEAADTAIPEAEIETENAAEAYNGQEQADYADEAAVKKDTAGEAIEETQQQMAESETEDTMPVDESEAQKNSMNESGVVTEKATLLQIGVASSEMKDQGYASVYTFETENGDKIQVYISDGLEQEMETAEITLERKKSYEMELVSFGEVAVQKYYLKNLPKSL